MDAGKSLFFIFIFIFIFIDLSTSKNCSSSSCRPGQSIVRFPFRLDNIQPNSCGYSGFTLFCDAINQTLIELPGSGHFTVQRIDYQLQHVWLNDPDNCLPRRLLDHLRLSESPFSGYYYQNFGFFNCTSDHARFINLDPIECLSGDNHMVYASSDERVLKLLASQCRLIKTVSVPVQWSFFEPLVSSDLRDDIRLVWTEPRCGRCVSRGGRCLPKNDSRTMTQCSYFHRPALPSGARYAIMAGAGFPVFLFIMGLLCCVWGKAKKLYTCRHTINNNMAPHNEPHTVVGVSGIDGPTIESYPKTMVLGESRRLPNIAVGDHSICSICLSEYRPKQTLRTIPECHHCFHAQCVDGWLRLKASCPICRKSITPAPRL